MAARYSATAYTQMLANLLPPGRAFSRDPDGYHYQAMQAFADEANRLDAQLEQVLLESVPATVDQLVSEWETALGFPNDCYPIPAALADRRAQLIAHLRFQGSATVSFFEDFATQLGYTVTSIDEYSPFVAGSTVGEALTNDTWPITWTVNVTLAGGQTIDQLECIFNLLKPVHTVVVFVTT